MFCGTGSQVSPEGIDNMVPDEPESSSRTSLLKGELQWLDSKAAGILGQTTVLSNLPNCDQYV